MSEITQTAIWIDAVLNPIMLINRQGNVIGFNRFAEAETGLSAQDLIGFPIWESPFAIDTDLESAFPLDSVASTITRFRTQNHDDKQIQWLIQSVISESGKPLWVCTGDIIHLHEAPYRQMFEYNTAVMLLIDPDDGRIIDANNAATQFYGYNIVDITRMTLQQISNQPDQDFLQTLKEGIDQRQPFLVFQHKTATHEILDVEIFPSFVEVGDRQLMYCVVVDITDRNLIEDALRSSELQYRQLVEMMQEGLSVQNEDNITVYVNNKLAEMLGYNREDFIDESLKIFMDEENAILFEESHKIQQRGESAKFELKLTHRAGHPVYVLMASTPIIDQDGIVTGGFSVITDITEQKKAEESLRQSNAELDAFAHTVAHDLKSPIAVIMGFANVLENDFVRMSDHELKDYLRSMSRTSDKMITIIDELLLLSEMRNMDEVEMQEIDMAEIVDGAIERCDYMREQYGATITIPDRDSWIPVASHGQWIEEVWVNYISNAIKYGGQPPQVEVGCTDEKHYVNFWVKDNGRGIPSEKLEEVFLPFTRLEQARVKGHGLGLSIVQRIIQKLGGEVHVASTLNEGSIFSFRLPK